MARRATGVGGRSRVWRAVTAGLPLVAALGYGVAGTVVHADEPPAVPDATVPTGEIDGATVAVGLPPVPPTSVVVEVGEPPVPPTTVVVEVGEPPVPPTTVVVELGEPPVPSSTVPDAPHPVLPDPMPRMEKPAPAAARIVATAAVSMAAALAA